MQKLIAIIGLEFGDEGKGKIVDKIVSEAQELNDNKRTVVVRFQGGTNAGHTIYVKNKEGELIEFITHAAPSGLATNADIAIGPHVAFDPEKFMEELEKAKQEFDYDGKIMISERVGILLHYHRELDSWNEQKEKTIGTTKSGIGPFYMDNANRLTRITFRDYISEEFPKKLLEVLESKKIRLEEIGLIGKKYKSIEEYQQHLLSVHNPLRKELKDFIERLEYKLNDYLNNGDHIIIEGAQGTMLDVDMGTIPDVTSSHLLAPHAFPQLGLPRNKFKIYGVEKIYPTRVGNGILPTMEEDDFCKSVAKDSGEFGATTGRARRVGYPDWVLIKRSVMINDCDGIYLTRTDCLQDKEIKVCTSYNIDGENTSEVPLQLDSIKKANYEKKTYNWKLWDYSRDLSNALKVNKDLKEKRKKIADEGFEKLPEDLKQFVLDHDEFVGCPTIGISIGPGRDEMVIKNS
jgi:adenylosuccinate synthase